MKIQLLTESLEKFRSDIKGEIKAAGGTKNIDDDTRELAVKQAFYEARENLDLISYPERAKMYDIILRNADAIGKKEAIEQWADELEANDGIELWRTPEPFEKAAKSSSFPISCLPPALQAYLKAVCDYVQIYPEQAILPLLSVLSLCVQGKALIKHTGNDYAAQLSLYTLTVANSGERKSASVNLFLKPVLKYQETYNKLHKDEFSKSKAEIDLLNSRLTSAKKSKKTSIEEVVKLQREYDSLEIKSPLLLNVTNVTAEYLIQEMKKQGEKMAMIDGEGGVFDVMSGMYSKKSQTDIDIYLKAYDGDQIVNGRKSDKKGNEKSTVEPTIINDPCLTIGLMTQTDHFEKVMKNEQFIGRGLMQRFLFSFPDTLAGERKHTSPNIPKEVKEEYENTINRLLNMPTPEEKPIILHDKEAISVFEDYFYHVETGLKPNGIFECIREWANKQVTRCLKIAAILHLCEHEASEPITGNEAQKVVSIATWTENQALRAFSGAASMEKDTKAALHILQGVKKSKPENNEMTRSQIYRKNQSCKEQIDNALDILEEKHYIKRRFKPTKTKNVEIIKFNPNVFIANK